MEESKLSEVVIPDTEAGLELPVAVDPQEELLRSQYQELTQEAIDESAEQRAQSPAQAAMMMHSRYYGPFVDNLDQISGGAAKRILRYLVGYPFFVPELNPQNAEVEQMAQLADKLVHCKFTIALCQSIEQEAKAAEELAKVQAEILPMPKDLPKAEGVE